MKIIKVSTELEMSVHEFPEGTMREQNKVLYGLIGNGCDLVEHVMPKRLYTELKMPYGTGSYRRETGYRLRIRRYLSPGTGWPREVFRRNDYGNEHHYIISTFFEVCDRDARHSKSRWSCSV